MIVRNYTDEDFDGLTALYKLSLLMVGIMMKSVIIVKG